MNYFGINASILVKIHL